MTRTPRPDRPEPQPDETTQGDLADALERAYTALIDDLAATLDLTAGVEQATESDGYLALGHDLRDTLDVRSGLVAITGHETAAPAEDPRTPRSTMSLEALRALPAPQRLALRTRSEFCRLRQLLDLLPVLGRAAADLDSSRARHHAYLADEPIDELHRALAFAADRARGPGFGFARAREFTLELDNALVLALDLTRGRDPRGAPEIAFALDRVLDGCRTLNTAKPLEGALRHALSQYHTRVHALARDHPLDLALARDHPLDRVRVRNLDGALTRALDLVRDLRRAFKLDGDLALAARGQLVDELVSGVRDVCRSHLANLDFALRWLAVLVGASIDLHVNLRGGDSEQINQIQELLADVADDFIDMDVRTAHLTPGIGIVDLVGVRWSPGTSWPSGWDQPVRAASEEIGPGIFRITSFGGRKQSTTPAHG